VADEAREWVDAYGGASGSDTGGTASGDSSRAKKRYAFRRGEPGKPEDSWTAIQRLADEVQWRAFMDRGRLFYVSDNWLRRQKPRFVISEDDDGIDEINFDIDSGKVSSDVTVTAHAKTFQVPVGCVVQVTEVRHRQRPLSGQVGTPVHLRSRLRDHATRADAEATRTRSRSRAGADRKAATATSATGGSPARPNRGRRQGERGELPEEPVARGSTRGRRELLPRPDQAAESGHAVRLFALGLLRL
jgi:hypothetical protein